LIDQSSYEEETRMDPIILLLILLIICGISAASFASDRNRSQAGWFIIGFLTGPFGLLVLLLLGARPEAVPPMKGHRLILAALAVVAVVIIAGMSLLEAASQYALSQRYAELEVWGRYGDALIRFAGSSGPPPDAFVVKAARDQITAHEKDLRDGMKETEDELVLAVRGIRRVSGAAGVLVNAYRLLTLRAPEWPAPMSLSTRAQEELIRHLNRRLEDYRQYLQDIEKAQDSW
jgi:hypothetical protein